MGIIIRSEISDKISATIPKSKRVIFVRLETKSKPIVIIQAYAPITKLSPEEFN